MATEELEPGRYSSGPYRVVWYTEASSQSFKQGELVYLNAGKVTAVASNGVVILGMAIADATTTTDASCPVLVAQSGTLFRMNAFHSSSASSAAAVTMLDDKWAVYVGSNMAHVDVGDSDNDALGIARFLSNIGDVYPFCEVGVLPEANQYLNAALT